MIAGKRELHFDEKVVLEMVREARLEFRMNDVVVIMYPRSEDTARCWVRDLPSAVVLLTEHEYPRALEHVQKGYSPGTVPVVVLLDDGSTLLSEFVLPATVTDGTLN